MEAMKIISTTEEELHEIIENKLRKIFNELFSPKISNAVDEIKTEIDIVSNLNVNDRWDSKQTAKYLKRSYNTFKRYLLNPKIVKALGGEKNGGKYEFDPIKVKTFKFSDIE